jgi:hypothetical protein
VTRVPQLEQELLAAATRLRGPRRIGARALRAALAAGAVALVVAVVVSAGDGGGGRHQAPGAPGFPPSAGLEDMLGVFRTPATPADDNGFSKDDLSELPDRQPGEDPTRSRRVEWPGATVFLWPMRDGVCYGVGGGGVRAARLPTAHGRRGWDPQLRPAGVGLGRGRRRHPGGGGHGLRGPEPARGGQRELLLRRPEPGGSQAPDSRMGGEGPEGQLALRGEGAKFRHRQAAAAHRPTGPASSDGATAARKPDVEPLAGSLSERLELTAAGISYTAVGFRTRRSSLCAALTEADEGAPPARAA